jgi:hypothetical protein
MLFVALVAAMATAKLEPASAQQPILQPSDQLIAIDVVPSSFSSYPGAENPAKAIDGIIPPSGSTDGNKYLNFGRGNARAGSGLIVTPAAATTVTGIQLATANDGIGFREPASYALFGTNDVINHSSAATGGADNSDSTQYSWTLISQGPLTPPNTTNTLYPIVNFANATSWTSYRIQFPTLQGPTGCCMQVAEVRLLDAANVNVLAPTNGVSAFQLAALSESPGGEGVNNLVDQNPATKYLNFGKNGAGFITTPSVGPRAVTAFQITTANDAEGRDPASWVLYGTNDPITSGQNSTSNAENWTLVDQGTLSLPADRGVLGDMVSVANTTQYASYRMVFPTLKDLYGDGVDSMQIAEIQFFGVPEPGTLALALVGLIGGAGLRQSLKRKDARRG